MTNTIEPTEEQKQAAKSFVKFAWGEDDVARLLAEREHKLRKQLAFMEAGSQSDYNAFAEALQKEDAYLAEINLINERLAELREIDGRKSRMLYDRDVVIDKLRVDLDQAEHRIGELRVALNVVEIECERRGEKVLKLQALNAEPVAHPDFDAARARIAEWEVQHGIDRASIASMAESIKRYSAENERLRATLWLARDVVEAHVPASGDELDDESGVCEVSTLEAIDEALADTAHYDVEGGEG